MWIYLKTNTVCVILQKSLATNLDSSIAYQSTIDSIHDLVLSEKQPHLSLPFFHS